MYTFNENGNFLALRDHWYLRDHWSDDAMCLRIVYPGRGAIVIALMRVRKSKILNSTLFISNEFNIVGDLLPIDSRGF